MIFAAKFRSRDIPLGTFVVSNTGIIGLLTKRYPGRYASIQIASNVFRRVNKLTIRPAMRDEVEAAGMSGVGGLMLEDLARGQR